MGIGTGIALIVIGAILVFALDVDLGWIDLDTVGYILMAAGLVVAIISLVLLTRRRQTIATSRSAVDPASGETVTRRTTESDDPLA
ncbi:DUF6458 family protein [Compostimonas suwonensis]|uniref:DUF6458 domain-containing protein n=1 Tax=Compostimonas suwonensis TaxID=1048394 RepID=A0A2M9BCB5_9MICO|nr:DUF6458 family protein [Compostimonas suwonensis]PJJ55587.1 hypothetical protein CLV54_2934 [Compostimonas suwonensis]